MNCCKMLKRETFLIFKNEKFSKKKILVYVVVFQKEYWLQIGDFLLWKL